MKNLSGKAIVTQDMDSLKIKIPAKKNRFIVILLAVLLTGWIITEIFIIKVVLSPGKSQYAKVFGLFFLIVLTYNGLTGLYTFLWQLTGYETIDIEKGILRMQKSIMGFGRSKQYKIKSIKNIKINPVQDKGIWKTKRFNNI